MKSNFTLRLRIVSLVIILITFVFVGRLFLVQVVKKEVFAERADRQYVTPTDQIFERGSILFTRKDGELVSGALQISGFKLAINPNKISNIENTYEKLNAIVPLDKEDFLAKANKKDDPYEDVTNHLNKKQADIISSLKLPGIEMHKEKWRFYPGNNTASHSLGFVGYQGDSLGGRYGLERKYDEVLSRDKDNPYINFFAEVFTDLNDNLFKDKVKKGDIVTTIEPNVEAFLEKEILAVKAKYNADQIGGIIMNPRDGSIYAVSSKPDFNLNDFRSVEDISVFRNPMVENVLEFGSIVKPLVMASALDAKVLKPTTTYTDNGFVTVEGKQIYNFDKKGRGANTSMQDVLNQSLNTGMVFAYKKLGKEKFRDYMLSYGIKEKTNIDLPNETGSLISNLYSPRELEYANASFGQGIALTPFQMIRALASLANGGNLVTPHFVTKIKYDDSTFKDIVYETKPTKISPETSREITNMLVTVMDKSLKGGTAKIERHSIGVKTGTAQVARPDGKGYYEDRNTHSFFGYFPAYDPKFIVLLYAVNPKGSQYAWITWADPFLNIAKFLLNYYEVPPDR
ncbi:MAG: penicillin-binding protein 2 [Candidatus Pacebacteria bacterium]|nr:penicillin-binding protein 2 [Candidatus Paceibacterota bacterium]